MRSTLLGFFADRERAHQARDRLVSSGLPVERVTLTAVQGLGPARARALAGLKRLFSRGRDRAGPTQETEESGVATVFARTHSVREAMHVTAIFRAHGVTEIAGAELIEASVAEPAAAGDSVAA